MSSTQIGINAYWMQKEWERQCKKIKPEVLAVYFIDVPTDKKLTIREKGQLKRSSASR